MKNIIMSIESLIQATRTNLLQHNYSSKTIIEFDRYWKKFVVYAKEYSITKYSPVVGLDYLHKAIGYPFQIKGSLPSTIKMRIRSIRLLNDFQEFGTIAAKLLPDKKPKSKYLRETIEAFKQYSFEHNHSKGTVKTQMQSVSRFFDLVIEHKNLKFDEVTTQHIGEYILTLKEYSQGTVKIRLVALRFFFKFLFENGYTKMNLGLTLPYVKGAKSERLPNALTDEECSRLFASIDRGSPIGKRDYAAILLAAKTGLRDSDVSNLVFDNLDWQNSQVRLIQQKTKEPIVLHMLEEVGEALIDYLKNGRPITDSKFVFVKHKAPFEKITSFYGSMAKYMNVAKIETKYSTLRGMHVLRHTLASGLIRQGETYETISAILGHVSSDTAKVYSHIDIDSLLKCALDLDEVTNG